MKNDFRISVGDDPDHEDLTAELYYQERLLAMITQEQGFEHLQIEIFADAVTKNWLFKLTDFLEVLEAAKNRLWELRRIP